MDTVAVIRAVRDWAHGSAEVCDTHRDGGPCEQLATALAMRFDALEAALDGLLGTERALLAQAVEEARKRAARAGDEYERADDALRAAREQDWEAVGTTAAVAGRVYRARVQKAEDAYEAACQAVADATAALMAFDAESGR